MVITSHGLIKVLDLEMRAALGERTATERESRDVIGLGALLFLLWYVTPRTIFGEK